MDSSNSTVETIAVVNFLLESSCCYRCIIRFLGIQVPENEKAYRKPREYLNTLLDDHKTVNPEDNNSDESVAKRSKPNICPVCLDCFEQKTAERIVSNFASLSIKDYEYKTFIFNVSFPKCLAIRAHGMLLHLKKHFPDYKFKNLYEKEKEGDIVIEPPHKIFRSSAGEIISKAINKQYHPKSNLSLLITIGYENDNLEVNNMKNIFKIKSSRKNQIETSRNNINEYLKGLDDQTFKNNFPVPPQVPNIEVQLEKVDITAEPIYLGGRYFKFKRTIGQTPWVINGVSLAPHNVEEIIFDAVTNVLRFNKKYMTFSSSGREDVDVRMLGSGRPFYIKVDNPKNRNISLEQIQEIEKQIIKSELVAVIKLQVVHPSDLVRIKHGEETKRKTYRGLCKTTAPNIKDVISKINAQKELTISQLTVMRVLHRRTLMTRKREIPIISAAEIPGQSNLFELEIVTQAGTYVKEFVHGDFERTVPSVSSIVGYPTDLVALDCVNIDLVWPEAPDT
ncbi:unnamed protein product [Ceutorhynchus assimilis]|uniref:tRNA pseudouridine(55) synthase n=1 Tax=Ceutorhynchus assimilis TaxID=467358 RepID=A0A9N9MU93_9CUCU|nr:unnamed protein product [Ceutorhynchus assimilis]